MSCDGGHLGFPIGIKNSNLVKDIPMIIHLQFGSVSSLVSEMKIFENWTLWEIVQMPSSQKLQI
jgi:hypothetical protein